MKTHLEEEVWLYVFLNSLPDGSGWSTSHMYSGLNNELTL